MIEADACSAYAVESFCEDKTNPHHHECMGAHKHREQNTITIHVCGCGGEFYFIDDALKALVAKVFDNYGGLSSAP